MGSFWGLIGLTCDPRDGEFGEGPCGYSKLMRTRPPPDGMNGRGSGGAGPARKSRPELALFDWRRGIRAQIDGAGEIIIEDRSWEADVGDI